MMSIRMIDVEDTNEAVSVLLKKLIETDREMETYKALYRREADETAELRTKLARYEQEVTL